MKIHNVFLAYLLPRGGKPTSGSIDANYHAKFWTAHLIIEFIQQTRQTMQTSAGNTITKKASEEEPMNEMLVLEQIGEENLIWGHYAHIHKYLV